MWTDAFYSHPTIMIISSKRSIIGSFIRDQRCVQIQQVLRKLMQVNILGNINDSIFVVFPLIYLLDLFQISRQRIRSSNSRHNFMSQLEQQNREEDSDVSGVDKLEQSYQTESQAKNIKPYKKPAQNKFQQSRKIMMGKVQEKIKNLSQDSFPYEIVCQFSEIRRKNCFAILKYLLFGYLQIVQQVKIKKLLKQQYLISKKTNQFIQQVPNQEKCLQKMIQKVQQIEKMIFQFHNTAGDQQTQSKKYQFHISHLIRNLSDLQNQVFREFIVNGSYTPIILASMDEIDMLQPSKRQYIFTKRSSLINNQEIKQRKHQRYLKLYSEQNKKTKRQRKFRNYQQFQVNKDNMNLQFMLSNRFIQKLEIELMQIPNRSVRKAVLLNLKNIFQT